jgi:hypothetical protein
MIIKAFVGELEHSVLDRPGSKAQGLSVLRPLEAGAVRTSTRKAPLSGSDQSAGSQKKTPSRSGGCGPSELILSSASNAGERVVSSSSSPRW